MLLSFRISITKFAIFGTTNNLVVPFLFFNFFIIQFLFFLEMATAAIFSSLRRRRSPSLEAFLAPVDLTDVALVQTLAAISNDLISKFSDKCFHFQRKNSRSLIRKIKVFLVLLDFLKDLILTTKATSALASASSTLPSQPSGADLPPFQPSGTDSSFSLPCRVGHGWQQYSSFHCRAMPRSLLLFFFLGFWFGLIWDWS